jgi:hypothetical protein
VIGSMDLEPPLHALATGRVRLLHPLGVRADAPEVRADVPRLVASVLQRVAVMVHGASSALGPSLG